MATRAGWRKVEYAGAEEEELREAEGLRQCSSKPHLNAPSGATYTVTRDQTRPTYKPLRQ